MGGSMVSCCAAQNIHDEEPRTNSKEQATANESNQTTESVDKDNEQKRGSSESPNIDQNEYNMVSSMSNTPNQTAVEPSKDYTSTYTKTIPLKPMSSMLSQTYTITVEFVYI